MGKLALLIGINYEGQKKKLNGCVNVNHLKNMLQSKVYKEKNIILMTDDIEKDDKNYPQR